jgi:hypothetical protein
MIRVLALALALLSPAVAAAQALQQSHPISPGEQFAKAMTLRKVTENIQGIWQQVKAGNEAALDLLPPQMETLNQVIAGGGVSEGALSVAYFYRGFGRKLQSDALAKKGAPVDPQAAQDELADLDKVLALEPNPVVTANAAYLAGNIAYNDLHDAARGYGYWQRCTALDIPACLAMTADARMTGADGQPVDMGEAIALHEKVVNAGIATGCTAPYSALAIAEITHFTAKERALDGELAWLKRGYELLDALVAQYKKDKSLCDRGAFELTEFLLRLSAGDRQEKLLHDADEDTGEAQTKAVAQYFAGALDDKAFAAALASVEDGKRCEAHFMALWYLALTKRPESAAEQWKAMAALGESNCRSRLTFARTFGLPAL